MLGATGSDMAPPHPPHSASAAPVELPTSPSRALRLPWVKPPPDVPLPRPTTRSGMFPEVPVVPPRAGLGLRRVVLWTVVLGAIGLVCYASWQRAAQARDATVMGTAEASAQELAAPDPARR